MEENVLNSAHELFKREFSDNSELYKFYDNLNSNIVGVNEKCNSCEDGKEDPEYMKLCCSFAKIIEKLDSICIVKENEKCACCDYILYWLYSKIIESNLGFRSIIRTYDKFEPLLKTSVFKVDSESEKKKIYDINVLKKKRVLFDFLLHYDIIKDKLNHIKKGKEEKFCNYIYYIFELYKEIETTQSGLYDKEKELFKKIFNRDKNDELDSLNKKCPGKCLDLFFKPESKNFCHLKEHKKADRYMPRILAVTETFNISNKIEKLKEEKNEAFKELPSNKIYDELNKDIENSVTGSTSRCDNLSLQNEKSKSFCKKIERNLKDLSTKDKLKNESHNDRCLYFNYWVHDELRKIFNGKTEDSYPNSKDIDKLRDEWYHISDSLMKGDVNENYEKIKSKYSKNNNNTSQGTGNINNSSGNNGHPISQNFYSVKDFSKHKGCFYNSDCTFYDCDDMKALYDYFKNHDTIENKISATNVDECKIYQKYVSYIVPIYDKYKDDCCNYGFCDYFNCNDKYDPNELLYKLKNCSERKVVNGVKPTRTKSEENEFYSRINKRKERFWISAFDENKTGYRYFRCYKKQNSTDPNMPNVASCYVVKTPNKEAFEDVFGGEQAEMRTGSNVSFSGRTISEESDTHTSVIPEDTCDTLFCDTSRMGLLGVLIVGTILLFFIYYKYTPLGQWLGNILFRKKKVKHNFYEEVRNPSPKHDTKRGNTNMTKKRIRIAYDAQGGNR
ncbi:VIR protein [Plasmodium vivax]|uniref:VIR protein n=2 Tax=Plasmodium vivax TaxID=5855 RepID=A0A1G4GRN3_PLAVI|nr:VIR protein [Plasmodium vivax]